MDTWSRGGHALSALCRLCAITNVAVLFFGETHKITSPEAMTGVMNLLIPDSWKNMRRASDPSWTVVARHAMMFTKRNCMHRKLKKTKSDASLYLENVPEVRSSRLSPSSEKPNRHQLKKRHRTLNVSSPPLAFPLRRKKTANILAKID
jgi:hypothetical protein